MSVPDLLRQRLRNQMLVRSRFRKPGDVVASLGAVQAQDYAGAKWALGLRAKGLTDERVERAFNDGEILRTHVLRPTWHFVSPADIRWLLALSAPRVNAFNAYYYRALGLDSGVFASSGAALRRALRGGAYLTRLELAHVLQRAGIRAAGARHAYLMMRAELDAVICSGPRRGKQFTYALLDERAPAAGMLARDEALAELTRRYFSSHGPATLRDYVWWSGLTAREAQAGIDMVAPALARSVTGGLTCWFAASRSPAAAASPRAHLLPNYDEYLIAYKDREPVVGRPVARGARHSDVFAHSLLVDGRLAGTWKRTLRGDSLIVEVVPHRPLTHTSKRAVGAAAEHLGAFMKAPVELAMK